MPHVIIQSCCNDASCVYACPVNCIHPTPDEPGFGAAEMLFVDPDACVDCGACVSACPVGAIVPDSTLVAEQLPFIELNAAFYPDRRGKKVPPTSKLAPVPPAPELTRGGRPLTVAIVGSGPAAMYAADELLTQHGVQVNVFEKLPTPYGLVRAGVAPDHPYTKQVTGLFDRISEQPGFRFFLNVEIGRHLSHAELAAHHHAVLYAVGASDDRRLDIAGMDRTGVHTATELVAWYNGHPEYTDLPVDLGAERVIIVGNGNVALDVARILTADPADLARTDIADHALAALRESRVREVVIAARRGPAESAFTLPELIGLTAHRQVVLDAADQELVAEALAGDHDALTRHKLAVLATLGDGSGESGRRVRLAYRLTPARVIGDSAMTAMEFVRTGADEVCRIEAGLLATSIGYHGNPIPDLPFDDAAGVVPNDDGRVVGAPGSYVAGWIKRGPTGFIGTNKTCARHTVHQLAEDFNRGVLADPIGSRGALERLVRERQPEVVDRSGWQAIDAAEITRGAGVRPRNKFTRVNAMLAVAAMAPRPTLRDKLREALRI